MFATMGMSLAAGLGFYELVLITLGLIVLVLNTMAPLEIAFKRKLRNITLSVEFDSVEDIANALYAKLGASNRAEAVDIAHRRHLLDM